MVLNPFPVYGDIAFVKGEARFSDKPLDAVRVDVHPVHLVLTALQQPFAQSVSDKSVNAQYQYLLFPFLFQREAGGQAESQTFNQLELPSQLRTGYGDTGFSLPGLDLNRALTAGDYQRGSRQDSSRYNFFLRAQDLGDPPEEHFAVTGMGKGAGIRFGHGSDQVANHFGRLSPVDFSIFRPSAAEIGRPRRILRKMRR